MTGVGHLDGGHLVVDISASHADAQPLGALEAVTLLTRTLESRMSDKRILPVFLLCFLFGVFGAHRFYVGKYGTAVLQLVTLGGVGIWYLVDLILIIVGAFTDDEGYKITEWT